MFHKYRVVLALFSLFCFFSACKVESLGDPIIVPFVDQEFNLDLWQTLGGSTPSNLEIQMFTIEEEDCLNTQILSDYDRVGRELSLTLYDILDPEVCDPGPAPAMGVQLITDATPDVYGLKVELQDAVSNQGTLTVTEDAYLIEMEEENGINWLHYELHRIPENALWGYLTYTNAAEENRVTVFLEEINELSSELPLDEGYYGYFSITNSGNGLAVKDAPGTGQAHSFLVKYTGETNVIDQKVSDFLATTGNEEITLMLLDSEGNEWQN